MWPLYLVGKQDLKQNQLVTRAQLLVKAVQSAVDGLLHSGVVTGRQGAQHGRLCVLDKGRKDRQLTNIFQLHHLFNCYLLTVIIPLENYSKPPETMKIQAWTKLCLHVL